VGSVIKLVKLTGSGSGTGTDPEGPRPGELRWGRFRGIGGAEPRCQRRWGALGWE